MTLRSKQPNRCKHCKVRMPADKAHHVIHNDCIEPWQAIREAKKALKAAKEKRVAAVLDRKASRDLTSPGYSKPQPTPTRLR